jgi:hypothetical protein
MKLFQTLLVSAVSLSLIPAAAVNALTINTIDDLTTSQQAIFTMGDMLPLSTAVPLSAGDSAILGTINRTLTISADNDPLTPIIQGNIPLPLGGAPGLSFSNGNGTDGRLDLEYDIDPISPVNFAQGGADRISIGLISSDLADAAVSVRLNGVIETISLLPTAPPEQVLNFLFSSFAGVDPTMIIDFAIILDPVLEGDISINILETRDNTTSTPEPATILGLLAVGLTGRVLRKAKK